MTYIDMAIVDLFERVCHRIQRLTGRTNVWLAFQLTNLNIVIYFIWAGAYFWRVDSAFRSVVATFGGLVLYALTQTTFKVPVETHEMSAYRRVAQGHRNPRRVRDAPLRVPFLTLSIVLAWPTVLVYDTLRIHLVALMYSLVLLTTVVLYLLACDPLPPCAGRIREWLGRRAGSPVQAAAPAADSVRRERGGGATRAA